MYKIEKVKQDNVSFLLLKNKENTVSAKILLDEGARIQELKFDGIFLISEQQNFEYKDSYASSILFPFASRIQEGKYTFKDKEYQLDCNEGGKNALHGLVFDKKFEVVEKQENSNNCAVTVAYKEKKESKGFPFTYEIYVTYSLAEKGLDVSIKIKNTDTKPYPFTLGWHPYFNSENLETSTLNFKSDKQIAFDENLITKEVIAYNGNEVFEIKKQQLDDCFILNTNKIEFTTPAYQIEITTDLADNYLQMYTPKGFSVIAIEPMTGVSNSFNNKIGLQVLRPNQSYSLNWNVKFNNN